MAEAPKLLFKFLVLLLFTSVCWWLWHPLGAALAILLTGYMRRPIVNNAGSWVRGTILIVGLLWGIGMAVAVRGISGLATSSPLLSVALYLEGLVAVGYVGYSPDLLDRYNKAGQTATVGVILYLLAMIGLVAIRGWVG